MRSPLNIAMGSIDPGVLPVPPVLPLALALPLAPVVLATPSPIRVNVLDDLSISLYLIPEKPFQPGSFGGAALSRLSKA